MSSRPSHPTDCSPCALASRNARLEVEQAIPVEIVITINASPCPSGLQYQTSCGATVRFGEHTIACKTWPIRDFVSVEWLTNYATIDLWLGERLNMRQSMFVSLKPAMRALRALIKRQARESKRQARKRASGDKPARIAPSSP